jgi:UDP-3-O-[3-hydroxymyristoyl] glucosamine N-acyltransferase
MLWNVESALSRLEIIYRSEGKRDKLVSGVGSLEDATERDLSFCSSDGKTGVLSVSKSRAGVILCNKRMEGLVYPTAEDQLLIFVENPRLAFIHLTNQIYKKRIQNKISPGAIISKTAQIGFNCLIGNHTIVGDNCKIGDNTVLYDRVSLVQNCIIGDNCIIQSGASIGNDGFAFERDPQSLELEPFPHFRGVKIGNNVLISANCSVARGSLSDTVINDGTKLDGLVHVAHNVVLGVNCELTAGTIIGGSTIVGDNTWLGLNCTLKNKIKVGKKVIVGCGAAVIHDVPDEDIVAGVPAKSIRHKVNSTQLFLMAGQQTVNNPPDEELRIPTEEDHGLAQQQQIVR